MRNRDRCWTAALGHLGNPTRSSSYFRMLCAGGKNARLWKSWHIDTRQDPQSRNGSITTAATACLRVLSVGSPCLPQFVGNQIVERPWVTIAIRRQLPRLGGDGMPTFRPRRRGCRQSPFADRLVVQKPCKSIN